MDAWLTTIGAAGKWILTGAVGVFVLTMMALVIYALRRGEAGDADVTPSIEPFGPYSPTRRRGIGVYRGARKLKVLASRETYVSTETLLSGTATREQWGVFIGIQVVLVCFWLIFVGIGFMLVPSTKGWGLLFPAIVSLWFFGVLKTVWDDVVAARRKLATATDRREPSA